MCSRCLWPLPAPVLTPGEFLVGEVFTDPSTFPQQKQLLWFGCVPCDQTCADTVTSFHPEAPGDTLSLGCFLCLHAQPLVYWPDPCPSAIPSWSHLSSFSLSQQLSLCLGQPWEHPRLQVGRGQGPSLVVLALPQVCLICLRYFLQLCPPHLGGGEEGKDVSNAFE